MGWSSFFKRKNSIEAREMTFVEHLEELRKHLIRSVLALVSTTIVAFFLTDFLFRKVLFYALDKNFPTYRLLCWLSLQLKNPDLCFAPVKPSVQTFDMGEAFMLHMKVCIFFGLLLAFPFIINELWKFIKPGLYDKEIKATRGVVFVTSFLFLLGVLFGYFVLAPFSINFLVSYQLPFVNDQINIIKASSYINYMFMFTLPTGIIFELPIFIFYLSKVGIITNRDMIKYRKHAIVVILFIAAIVTPPDVISQIIVTIPVYLLYEISIGIAAKQTKLREKEEQV